ncbi:poly(adp-ribose) glycohydrolase [Anaeramoeba flamelloides]|uniref:Poly(Adp-ribose) glycohydrolase n=1 Tax=Anaeramoeba flamelloides TaxID=1746091 RepID=A0ABQ8ZE26_9EUKA|nr:poly(adp-ribose) glycohydrolase [Anaeramoeba flamelloides]
MKKTIKKHLLAYLNFSSEELYKFFPPVFSNSNKQVIAKKMFEKEYENNKELMFSKWGILKHPKRCECKKPEIEMYENTFQYEATEENETAWYPNFADRRLFGYYSGNLLAQDELQVLEHPILGSLRNCLKVISDSVDHCKPLTRSKQKPTPVLIMNAEKRCSFHVEPNAKEGRPQGLYGNKFACTSTDIVLKALELLNPPTFSNFYVMEAPKYGRGNYTTSQIYDLFSQCYTGYTAAKLLSTVPKLKNNSQIRFNDQNDFSFLDKEENVKLNPIEQTVTIHLGHWGGGAYGGNKVMVTIIQLLAGYLTGIDKMIYHTFNQIGTKSYNTGFQILEKLIAKHKKDGKIDIKKILSDIEKLKLKWGFSDGN